MVLVICIIMVSIHASRAGRDSNMPGIFLSVRVSIHASRAGRDLTRNAELEQQVFQSTRPVRDATPSSRLLYATRPFQSTRPVRDATSSALGIRMGSVVFQSTRPVRDATYPTLYSGWKSLVSIHASRAGRDGYFPSVGRAQRVSIHASRAGRDGTLPSPKMLYGGFNPRVPCGTRPFNPCW